MDNTDLKIIECLKENARINASEIASRVSLSTSAVIERIKKLENSGIIMGYTAVLSPQKLNKDIIALISIAIDSPKYNTAFEEAIMNNTNITECFYVAGSFDYLVKIITRNTKTLEQTLHYIKAIPGVSKTVTDIVLSTCKNEYSVPVEAMKEDINEM